MRGGGGGQALQGTSESQRSPVLLQQRTRMVWRFSVGLDTLPSLPSIQLKF